jgi:tRNA A37 threonylcarbamoyladenosine biosynthesis protein TsaE
MPVAFEELHLTSLTPELLRESAFGKQPTALVIHGEGGAGKTSLACQIMRWCLSDNPQEWALANPTLPILIQYDLDEDQKEDEKLLFETIKRVFEDTLGLDEPPDDELIEALLRHRRITVTIDNLSELSQQTRNAANNSSVKSLIVTSRKMEELEGRSRVYLRPQRVDAEHIIEFLSGLLNAAGIRDRVTDTEFLEASTKLKALVGHRAVTLLLVRLFADQLVDRVRGALDNHLPRTIPELMLAYINRVNSSISDEERCDVAVVQRDAMVVARMCIGDTFRPYACERQRAVLALGEDAEKRLAYLQARLQLLETVGIEQNRLRFQLDPLAEYLAAIGMVNELNEREWRKVINDLEQIDGELPEFAFALWDCLCLHRHSVPHFVFKRLEKLLGEIASVARTTQISRMFEPATIH